MSRSPFQRFVHELRRRHVPQTAAIYLVAAWAAIQFADVVVPNLNGPQWIVTAVIIATLVGFPVMLVMAWVFEWGPGGIHKTEDGAAGSGDGTSPEAAGAGSAGGPAAGSSARMQPWLVAIAVLVVGIGSALAVEYVTREEESAAPSEPVVTRPGADTGMEGPGHPAIPTPPEDAPGAGIGAAAIRQAMSVLDSMGLSDMSSLAELSRLAGPDTARSELEIIMSKPEQWRPGPGPTPRPLARGDTLVIEGVALDSAGVVLVSVDGTPVVTFETAQPAARFSTRLVGRAAAGIRDVVVMVRTADDREIRRTFQIVQMPGGTP